MNKQQRHETIRERAENAVRDLYHNATLPWFGGEYYGRTEDYAQAWLESACEFEIDYLRDGGAYGKNYRATLAAPCNAGKYKSERARAYYIAKGMRAYRLDVQGWERITEYGKLYQYGRGGRTLAPADLWNDRGNNPKFDAAEHSIGYCVELIQIVESFNAYVAAWCAGVPEMWREHCAEEDAEELRQKRQSAARKAKETRERNYWNARDVMTVAP